MSQPLDINSVRRVLVRHVGRKVKIRENRGRHKVDVTEGIISETYPSIFLIQVEATDEIPERRVSFSYTDVITRDIELTLCHE